MKKYFIYKYGLLLSVLIALGCSSCQKDDYVQYDAGYASLRFIYEADGNDSIVYSFALHPDKEEDIVEIPFKLIGLPIGEIRQVGLEIVKLEEHNLTVAFRLCENENFKAAPINENTFSIVLTNHLSEPTGWPFGDYSRIKHQFVIQVLGIATDYDKWSTSEVIHYTSVMIDALYEYNKAHPGEPLTDENGLVITF